jgi:hypothetical protein
MSTAIRRKALTTDLGQVERPAMSDDVEGLVYAPDFLSVEEHDRLCAFLAARVRRGDHAGPGGSADGRRFGLGYDYEG